MNQDRRYPFGLIVNEVRPGKGKSATEARFCECLEKIRNVSHGQQVSNGVWELVRDKLIFLRWIANRFPP